MPRQRTASGAKIHNYYLLTNLAAFLEIRDHGDAVGILLPNHVPEISKCSCDWTWRNKAHQRLFLAMFIRKQMRSELHSTLLCTQKMALNLDYQYAVSEKKETSVYIFIIPANNVRF